MIFVSIISSLSRSSQLIPTETGTAMTMLMILSSVKISSSGNICGPFAAESIGAYRIRSPVGSLMIFAPIALIEKIWIHLHEDEEIYLLFVFQFTKDKAAGKLKGAPTISETFLSETLISGCSSSRTHLTERIVNYCSISLKK